MAKRASYTIQDPDEFVYATFRWPVQLGGEEIYVSGSWDAWSSQTNLAPVDADGRGIRSQSGDAVRTLLVPRGVHDYKYVVDDKWRAAPADPVARDQAGATNNKRLFAPTGLITFRGRRDMEVLVMGAWSDFVDAQRMLWNPRKEQWELPLALPPGQYAYVLRYNSQYKLDPNAETVTADVLGQSRTANLLTVSAPPCAFTVFYATGWQRCSLVYRVVEREGAEPGEWYEVPLDGAPSRAGPGGGRWMQAIVEAPGPEATLQFYVRGPRPDINDEWGSSISSSRRTATDGGNGGYNGNGGGNGGSNGSEASRQQQQQRRSRGTTGSVDAGGDPRTEDRPSKGAVGGGVGGEGTYYTLPWPSGWKLDRGKVSKFLRALQAPIMLCSDVDGTFVTDKQLDAWGDSRVADFKRYWEDMASLGGSVLVLNTGRSKGHLMALLKEKEEIIAVPDVIITAVGTKIWHRRSTHRAFGGCSPDDYEEDLAWTTRLDERWDLETAREVCNKVMSRFNGNCNDSEKRARWLDYGSEHPHRLALNVRVDVVADISATLEEEIGRSSEGKWGIKSHIIASGAGDWRYLDVVAEKGGKLEAIEWVRRLYGVPASRCMTAGDSFNDVEMFKGESPAVIVGNAQPELLDWYNAYRESPPGRIVLARGVDALGVMEGLARHGLL